MSGEIITVPWTQEQVDGLNNYQRQGWFHPYTCPNRGDGNHTHREERGGDLGALLATPSGWICGECTYTQNWAHAFSVDAPKPAIVSLMEGKQQPEDPEETCPFCGKSRFIHSGITVGSSAQDCWDRRAAVAMLRDDELDKRPDD